MTFNLILGFSIILAWLSWIDYKTHRLPNWLTLPLMLSGLYVNLFDFFCSITEALLGTLIGYCWIASFYLLWKYKTGRVCIGLGDAKLLAALGAWFGIQALSTIVLISSFTGCITLIIKWQLCNRPLNQPIAFGPFLSIGALGWLSYSSLSVYFLLQ